MLGLQLLPTNGDANVCVKNSLILCYTLHAAFKSLPKQMRRHDTNLLLRTLSGPPIMGVAIYIAVKTFDDLEWWYKNQVFVSYWMLIFLTIDLFDLSQRRKFDWQPYVHHTLQTLYGLYLFDWTTNYYRSFPSIGLVILSSGDRWKFSLFPLRRVVKDKKGKLRPLFEMRSFRYSEPLSSRSPL